MNKFKLKRTWIKIIFLLLEFISLITNNYNDNKYKLYRTFKYV